MSTDGNPDCTCTFCNLYFILHFKNPEYVQLYISFKYFEHLEEVQSYNERIELDSVKLRYVQEILWLTSKNFYKIFVGLSSFL